MLGSITPLGERGRGRTWGRTVAALVVGGLIGGGATGAMAGLVGSLVIGSGVETQCLLVLSAALAISALLDIVGRAPSIHRQVNEDWLYLYRDWVYGLGFGIQLGVGAATIVTTAAVYASVFAAFLTGSWIGGAMIGVMFGVLRNAAVLLAADVRTPEASGELDARLARWAVPVQRATPLALFVAGGFALVAALGF